MRNNTRPTRRENVRSNLVRERYLDWLRFRLFTKKPGVANLARRITFDSGGTDPTFVYYGGDANATNITAQVGETLTKGAGTPTLNNDSPFLGTDDDSVLPDGSTYYQAAAGTFGNIGTNDIFIEGFIKGGAAGYVMYKKNGAGEGWYLYSDGTKLQLVIEDSSTNTATVSGAANSLTPGEWNYFSVYIDKSDAAATGSNLTTNGATAGTGVDCSAVGDCDSAINFTLLADNAGATGYAADVAYLALYQGAALWPGGAGNTTLFQAISRERCTRLTGFFPQIANGTPEPVTQTRAFAAYTDKYVGGVRTLYKMGSELLRMPQRYDGSKTVFGYLPEVQSTNQIPFSQELDNVAWTLDRCTISADAIAAPDGTTTADGIIATSVENTHYLYDSVTTSAGIDAASFWAKKGDQDWVYGYIGGIAASCYFDLDNGVVGTAANCTGYIEDWGNDWYRCIMVLTGDGASRGYLIYAADGDGDTSFTGDDVTVSTYVWGIQYEQGQDYATSYIPTSGATATRLCDQLRYKGDDGNIRNNQKGTCVCEILMDNINIQDNNRNIAVLSDGGAAADNITMRVTTSEVYDVNMRATAGNDGDVTLANDIANGASHKIRTTWKTNNFVANINGDNYTDTDCGVPGDIDRVDVGQGRTAATQFNDLICSMDFYSEFTDEG